ncbi:uncharacterized protein BO88DRAFT_352125, partial [Aspergillus vadensis CBS 113365]
TDNSCLSENTEDRDFIISNLKLLSEYSDELEKESEDYIPKVVSDNSFFNKYLVLWYSWETGEAVLELIKELN